MVKNDDGSYLSSYSVHLTKPCSTCGVWIGADDKGRRIEFDGSPHSGKRCVGEPFKRDAGLVNEEGNGPPTPKLI